MKNLVGVRHRSVGVGLLLSTALISVMAAPGSALAACGPSPTQTNVTTTCTGLDSNGILVATTGSTINIDAGAVVQAPAGTDAVYVTSNTPTSDPFYNYSTINVNGSVLGGSANGIHVRAGALLPGQYPFQTLQSVITVGSGGTITGSTGISVSSDVSDPFNQPSVILVNSGVVSGFGGLALSGLDPSKGYFSFVNNLAGGQIGAINAFVQNLTNAGTINGGTLSAYTFANGGPFYFSNNISNTGSILSASVGGTIDLPSSGSQGIPGMSITNSGQITNSGSGAAIVSARGIGITNAVGGTISAGVNAIVVSGPLDLVNRGVITGTIDASAPDPYFFPPFSGGSRIDNSGGGIINGSVLLGAGNDFLTVDYNNAGNPISGISGTVDAGAGSDTLRVKFSVDTTLNTTFLLPPSFERLIFDATTEPYGAFKSTITLASGFSAPTTIGLNGKLINNTDLSFAGQAFYTSDYAASLTNNGSITSVLPVLPPYLNNFAIDFFGYSNVVNTGSIVATGGSGISVSGIVNSGSIVADQIGVRSYAFNGFANSGEIRSNFGVGVELSGNGQFTNSGTIAGALAGLRLSATLVNSGTISSSTMAVDLQPYGVFDNRAGGVITGGTMAIGEGVNGYGFFVKVINAGTINGNVNLANSFGGLQSNNMFVALAGGVVNGNLHLGSGGDTLVVNLPGAGGGPLGGVTGTITGSGSETLRYTVDRDATTTVSPVSIFSTVAYDLSNSARLNLSTVTPQALGMQFAGTGTVDFAGNLTGPNNGVAVNLTLSSIQTQTTGTPPNTFTGPVPTAITFTNTGTITQARSDPFNYGTAAVALDDRSSVTNAGTIIVRDSVGDPFSDNHLAGIFGNGIVTNTGTISVDGAFGILGSSKAVNTGVINQIAGGVNGKGVVGVRDLTNSGLIITGGDAVTLGSQFQFGPAQVSNSGAITSTAGSGIFNANQYWQSRIENKSSGSISGAVAGVDLRNNATLTNAGMIGSAGTGVLIGNYATIENLAGGTITGGVAAIASDTTNFFVTNRRISNAGTINGNVDLSSSIGAPTNNMFIALDGGVVNGNLNLGSGGDTLVTTLTPGGRVAGVTGAITGSGYETIRYLVNQDVSAVIGISGIFSAASYDIANNARVTLSAATPQTLDLQFAGTGTVDLNADINGVGNRSALDLRAQSVQVDTGQFPVPTELNVTSRGTIAKTRDQFQIAAPIVAIGFGSTFTNAGTISVRDTSQFGALMSAIGGSGTVINSGSIKLDGGIGISDAFGDFTALRVINAGTISQITGAANALGIIGVSDLTNSGTVRTGGTAVSLGSSFGSGGILSNSGTISSVDGYGVATQSSYYAPSRVINAVGGTISGGMGAIGLTAGSLLNNAGTINGDVDLAFNTFPFVFYSQGSTYVSRGGTINGNLKFGASDDLFVSLDGSTGVSGTIDGGAGIDTLVRSYTANTTVNLGGTTALPLNFEREGIAAIGRDVIVTVNGPMAGLDYAAPFFGDGTIINRADVKTRPNPDPFAGAAPNFAPLNRVVLGDAPGAAGIGSSLNFINDARLADGVSGTARGFSNAGTIGATTLGISAVQLSPVGNESFSFLNSGSILNVANNNSFSADYGVVLNNAFGNPVLASATVTNSGTITAGLSASILARDFSFTNSGTIGKPSFLYAIPGVDLRVGQGFPVPDGDQTATIVRATNTATGSIDQGMFVNARARVIDVTNGGLVTLGLGVYQAGDYVTGADYQSVSVLNSGTLTGTRDSLPLAVSAYSGSVVVSNTGEITTAAPDPEFVNPLQGALVTNLTSGNQTVSFTNQGTITNDNLAGTGVMVSTVAATSFLIDPTTPPPLSNAEIIIANSGTIRANGGAKLDSNQFIPDVVFEPIAGLVAFALADGTSSVSIRNTGTIEAKGNLRVGNTPGGVTDPLHPEVANKPAGFGSIAVVAYANRVAIDNGGLISGGAGGDATGLNLSLNVNEPVDISALFPDNYIAGAIQTFLSVDTVTNSKTGVITGSIDLGAFDDTLQNFGTITGNVFLRDGNDGLVHSLGGTLNGVADGGAGTDMLTIDINGGGLLSQGLLNKFVNFERTIFTGTGTITTNGPLSMNTFTLSGGQMTIAAGQTLQTAGPVTITNVAGNNSIINFGTIAGGVSNAATFTNGVDGVAGVVVNSATASNAGTIASLSNSGGTFVNTGLITGATMLSGGILTTSGTLGGGLRNAALVNANGGALNGAVVNAAGGTINVGGLVTGNGAFTNSTSTSTFNINAGGFTTAGLLTNNGTINIANGAVLRSTSGGIANNASIVGAVTNGSNFSNAAGATVSGLLTITGGTTTNLGQLNGSVNVTNGTLNSSGVIAGGLTNAGTVNASGGTINGGIVNQAGGTVAVAGIVTSNGAFNNAAATSVLNLNSGSLTLGGALTNNGVVNFNGGALVTNMINNLAGGTLNGVLNFGNANGVLVNAGRVAVALTFGAGNDLLTIRSGATFGGAVNGGAGSDLLVLASGGTDTTPDEFNLSTITGFERTRQDSGTVALSGTLSTGTFDIVGGRLIGRASSTINASTITVGTGTIFGSAGTVNSNIVVNGTLSPGASPGTMTVNGNVSLAAGSVSLFELSSTVNDQLLISGALNIASTAVLTLTGARPLTPGSTLDLIVANGGITGSFGTINKPASILGFVAQRGNRISLLGQFLVDPTFNPQTAATVTYVNTVLTSGQASAALLGAIPSLLTAAGNTDGAAFARLNPEAYASATHIGTENGLSLASALRGGSVQSGRDDAGLFTFAEGLGAWRKLPGSSATGASRANVNSAGLLGGIGFGSKTASFGAFVGYLNASQSIDALGARNKADGIVTGVSGHLSMQGFQASATLAFDGSSVDTTRSVPGAGRTAAHYNLRSVVADVALGYSIPVGDDWAIKPGIGFTSIWTKRGAANETGTTPFNLAVARDSEQASFVDGAVELRRDAGTIQPWIRFGVRHQLSGAERDATAALVGATTSFTVVGVSRGTTMGTAGAGLSASIGKSVSLITSYEGEFGNDASGHKVNAGLRVAF